MTASDQPADPAADRDPPARLPAAIPPGALTAVADPVTVVPALIADAGDAAGWRYVEFFTANIRNPHTRRAYARACSRFFAWCEGRALTTIRPHDVATYMESSSAGYVLALRRCLVEASSPATRSDGRRAVRF
jgi:hypothetical protein